MFNHLTILCELTDSQINTIKKLFRLFLYHLSEIVDYLLRFDLTLEIFKKWPKIIGYFLCLAQTVAFVRRNLNPFEFLMEHLHTYITKILKNEKCIIN